ncbi:MAG: hypothetical protein US70_C0004G0006 [Parcubacteria group bacterium GW2011_GWD2_38_11]|nr:MAG: hypothetical protein US70_C0004G0006 [Parcubacteria group bacterium GW2011_GWD2_38_11]
MLYKYVTSSSLQTKKLGSLLAEELCGGEVICLSGDLGAGKTTFTQGLLKGLKIKGPYTSPTFSIIKEYKLTTNNKQQTTRMRSKTNSSVVSCRLSVVRHIDAYRISSKDLLELGFEDFAGKACPPVRPGARENSITIIEWLPTSALWINFQWLSERERKITLSSKKER